MLQADDVPLLETSEHPEEVHLKEAKHLELVPTGQDDDHLLGLGKLVAD